MQRKYIIEHQENTRLVLFFTGWATDYHVLEEIYVPAGYDLMCCWGYDNIEWRPLERTYEEVVIIAWSFGVSVVNSIFNTNRSIIKNLTGVFAINGSFIPVDNNLSISDHIFEATLNNLDERNLLKFKIRICGGKKLFEKSCKYLDYNQSITNLKEELKTFKDYNFKKEKIDWDFVFISENDKIFPIENLKKAWADTPYEIIANGEHLPDFQKIFNIIIKDKKTIGKNFEKSISSYGKNAIIQSSVADKLLNILESKIPQKARILEIGSGEGYLSKRINKIFSPQILTLMDLTSVSPVADAEYVRGDVETTIQDLPSEYYDLAVSGSTLQWVHSPLRILKEIYRILKPGGEFLFSTFLKGNLKEVSDLTGSSLLYLSEQQWEMLSKKAGFKIELSENDTHTLQFDNVNDIFNHLKLTGVNSLNSKNKSITTIKKIISGYPKEGDKFSLTYVTHIMLLKK